ncbi:MAG: hypothetical protein OHK0013_35700 [Sandaracinaceae bacterium]
MRGERIGALLGLGALAVALQSGLGESTPAEIPLALVALAAITATASPRLTSWLERTGLGPRAGRSLGIVLPLLALAALYLGGPTAWDDMGHRGDWPVNEAFVRTIRDAIANGYDLRWSTRIAPGDPTLDLYPTLAHTALAHVSLWLGDAVSLHRVVVGAAVVAFVAVSLGVARAAHATGAPWSASALVGAACLFDYGSDFSWGARATFFWGFFPSTLALGVWFSVLPSALVSLRRPCAWRRGLVAAGLAVAATMHPVGLVLSGALVVGLAAHSILGHPVDRTRSAVLLFSLGLGLALAAPIWAPASQRVLDLGVHFGTPQVPIETAIERMARGLLPDGSFPILVFLGWVGGLRGLALRRAPVAVIVVTAFFLVSLYVETLFLDLGVAPSVSSVRWQSYRVGTFVKPLVYVLAAHGLGLGASFVAALVSFRARWSVRATAALAGALVVWLADPRPGEWLRQQAALRRADVTGHELADRASLDALRAHLRDELAALAPGQHARLLLFCPLDCPYELMDLAWDPGVPVLLHHPAPAGHFLRDQFFDTSPENLRRFGVRWAVAVARTPPPGEVASERRFGGLVLRDVPGWDGEIAHVVRGAGTVRTTVVEGRGFDLDVDADEPVRVELGTPYYPRLRAWSAGRPIAVEPLRVRAAPPDAVDPGERAVVLELPPGRTAVRADGPLSSDAAGRGPAVIAGIVVAILALARARASARLELLFGAVRRWWSSRAPGWAALVSVGLGLALVPMSGADARGLRFGLLFPRPRMHLERPARSAVAPAGERAVETVACEPISLGRSYRCGDAVEVRMVVVTAIQDWHVGWPVPVPAVEIRGAAGSTLVLETSAALEGVYFGSCELCSARVASGGEELPSVLGTQTSRLTLPRAPTTTFRVTARGSIARLALVRADLVEPSGAAP